MTNCSSHSQSRLSMRSFVKAGCAVATVAGSAVILPACNSTEPPRVAVYPADAPEKFAEARNHYLLQKDILMEQFDKLSGLHKAYWANG
jgi:hypothetical protein